MLRELAICALLLLGLVLMSLLSSCGHMPPRTALDARVVSATTAGWEHAELPKPDAERCELDAFRVEWAKDAAEFKAECWVPPERAYSCFVTRMVPRRVRAIYYPAALVRPGTDEFTAARAGVHELAHGLNACVKPSALLPRQYPDIYDHNHTNPRVWRVAVPYANERLETGPPGPLIDEAGGARTDGQDQKPEPGHGRE